MKKLLRRAAALLCALALTAVLCPQQGKAAPDVYFTAANENVMDLLAETMPFWSDGELYVSNALFLGRELGVSYVRNNTMGLAVLYTNSTDLRFDLAGDTVYDRDGNTYSGHAVEKGDYVFFPVDLVCRYFGLKYSYTDTELAPLIRLTSDSVILEDARFIDSATTILTDRYNAYQRTLAEQEPDAPPPISQAAEGQKVFLLIAATSAQEAMALLEKLDQTQVTFLLPPELMEDGDLVRAVTAGGHALALAAQGDTEETVQAQLELAREQVWRAACLWLELVWYDGPADVDRMLEDLGCLRLSAGLDQSGGLTSPAQAYSLMASIGRYREDLAVFLGEDAACAGGLEALTDGLALRKYSVCAWRLAG